jgi:hypothetical protein
LEQVATAAVEMLLDQIAGKKIRKSVNAPQPTLKPRASSE